MVFVSTDNDGILATLEGSDGTVESNRSVEGRVLSIYVRGPKQGNPLGVWSKLPSGSANSESAVKQMSVVAKTYYGQPFRRFMKRLVQARFDDETALIAKIRGYRQEYLDDIAHDGSDGVENRKGDIEAIIYAAGRLARGYGALPGQKAIGPLLPAFRRIFGRAAKPAPKTDGAHELLRKYIIDNQGRFIKPKSGKARSKTRFHSSPGYIVKSRKGRMELVISKIQFDRIGLSHKQVRHLASKGNLIGEKGEHPRSDTRRFEDILSDRVFVVNLDKFDIKL